MTWGVEIVKGDGTRPDGTFYGGTCRACKHGGSHAGGHHVCNVSAVAQQIASLLTAIDVGADGHMAAGNAVLQCHGFEAKPEPAGETAHQPV